MAVLYPVVCPAADLVLLRVAQVFHRCAVVRLVNGKGTSAAITPDAALVRLVAKGHQWWGELRKGEIDIKTLAKREGVQASYLTRVLRLAFLAPEVIEAMLAGRHGARATIGELTLRSGVDPAWDGQRRTLIGAT